MTKARADEGLVERLLAAISWLEPPFVDDDTPDAELRARIKLCVADAKRALANLHQIEEDGNG